MATAVQETDSQRSSLRIRINTEVRGEPASVLLELKRRGLVRDNTEAVTQGLLALYEKVLERDLAKLRVQSAQESGS